MEIPPIESGLRKRVAKALDEPDETSIKFVDGIEVNSLWIADVPLNNIPIHVYRSSQWSSDIKPEDPDAGYGRKIDDKFKHKATYYTIRIGMSEYYPDDLKELLEKTYQELKKRYGLDGISFKDSDELFRNRNKSAEDKERYEEHSRLSSAMMEEFKAFENQQVDDHEKISDHIITFKNPLVISDYDYQTPFSQTEHGIRDIRYITEEEIEGLKSRGYDGIIFFQYNWFITFS